MNKMFSKRNDNKCSRSYTFPTTKLRNVFCTHCKHQFFLREFVPLQGLVPLLLECGHVICDRCAKLCIHEPCPLCNVISQSEDNQKVSLPLNMYALGLMVMSHNRPVDTDDSDISFTKSVNSKTKQQSVQGLCHECGIQAAIKCPQCVALYCFICYSKIHGKALQSHSKIMLFEGTNDNSFAIQNTCSQQCTELLGYYCENCEIAGCSHCMLHLHKKHNCKTLLEKNQELLSEFYGVLKQGSENLQRIHQAQKKLSRIAIYPREMHNIDSVEAAVTQHFAYLHGVLQNVEKKIIDSLQEHRNSRSNNIEMISQQLREYENQLQSALLITASVTDNLDKVDVQEVIRKMQDLINMPCHLVLNSIPSYQEITFDVDKNIIDAIKNHYTVNIPPTSKFILKRSDSLPDDYVPEPLTEDLNISINKRRSSASGNNTSVISIPPKKSDNLPAVGSSEMIRVSYVVNPSCFYAQMIQNQNKINELEKRLALLANNSGTKPTEVTINGLYIVQCFEDKVWHRARVTDRKRIANGDERYSVYFIDYGMKEDNVPLEKIRNIIPQFAMLPMMAIRCTLHDVVPNNGEWHPDAIVAFRKMVCSNAMVSMSVMMITGDTYYVDLSVISSNDWHLTSVKDSLTYMKFATCVSPNKLMRTNPDSMRTYYKEQLELKTYIDVEILFVESPSCIYVKKAHGNRSYFRKLVTDMTENYGQTLSCNDFIPVLSKDLPCAARGVDGLWHRGTINEVTENTIRVFYVDLGYTLMLNYDAVRALPRKYMSCKTQAIKISLRHLKPNSDDKNQWGQETIEYLKRYLMDIRNVKIIAFEKSEDTYSVAMYTYDNVNVGNMLVANDLAVQTHSPYPNNSKKKKNKPKKEIIKIMDKSEKSNDVQNTTIKNRSMEENEDPFKVNVLIHQVQSPDCIYVSNATHDHSDIETMMAKMQDFYRKYRSAKRDVWNKDAVCAVYSLKNEMFYRGRIVDVKSADRVVVFLYDMGVEETVTMNDIQSLYPMFLETPTYVFRIKLSGILPCGGSSFWPTLSCEKLQEIVDNNHNCKFYISKLEEEDVEDSAAIPVELWIKQVKMDGPLSPTRYEINSINRMLVEHGVALPMKEYAKKRDKILAIELKRILIKKLERLSKYESNVKWFGIDDLNDSVEINMNKNVPKMLHYSESDTDSQDYDVEMFDKIPMLPKLSAWLPAEPILEDSFIAIPTYLDHDGFLYLHSKSQNAEILKRIERKLEKLYTNCPIESHDTVWAAGDMCIAQYHTNEKWYRGKVVKVQGNDIVDVEFIDYGNVEECSIGTLKKRVVLENVPIQCTKCMVYGLNPANSIGKWMTTDLDKIHGLLIEKECEVTVLDRTETHLVISVTVLPNEFCKKKSDLIKFLINEWEMKIKPDVDFSTSQRSVSTSDTADVVIESIQSFSSDNDIIISGSSVLGLATVIKNKNESSSTADVENLSWRKLKNQAISSTPHVTSEENLLMNYRLIDLPEDLDFIEIELCFSISLTEFYAHLEENSHSKILNNYYEQYILLMKDLQENACKQQTITNFAPNTPCCAKFNDDIWYRSLIIESEPVMDEDATEIKLIYVDYGNCEYRTVNSQQCELFALKKEWMDVPIMAIKCKLWNIDIVPTANIDDFLTDLEKMYKRVIATIKKIDEEFVHIELYENAERKELLYDTLIEGGLFQFTIDKH